MCHVSSASLKPIQWLPDSGADVDALTVADLEALSPDLKGRLVKDTAVVLAANGGDLGPMGTLPATLSLGDNRPIVSFMCMTNKKSPFREGHVCRVRPSR